MFKPVSISFRTSEELRSSLDRIGRQWGRSRSSLIETVLREFLHREQDEAGLAEKGEDARTVVLAKEGDPQAEETTDIVLGGVRIALSKDLPIKIAFDEETSTFRIEFDSNGKRKFFEVKQPSRGP
jgi:predicted transcriptional regulator